MRIYFAGPLFSQAEIKFNKILTERLEVAGFEVFLPQRDGVGKDKPPYNKMTKDVRRKTMFELDRNKILKSDIFLFILDGRIPDEGACVELGIAYTQKYIAKEKKYLIGLVTNKLRLKSLNPMIRVPLDYIAESEKELIECIRKYKK